MIENKDHFRVFKTPQSDTQQEESKTAFTHPVTVFSASSWLDLSLDIVMLIYFKLQIVFLVT